MKSLQLVPVLSILVSAFAAACSANGGDDSPDARDPAVAKSSAAAELDSASAGPVELNRYALSHEFTELTAIPAGVAADLNFAFIGSPLEGRVNVISRRTKAIIAELPPPPSGFALPFILHALGPGRVGVLDAGGLPSPDPFVPANPTIYEYSYGTSASGVFTAQLTRSVSFGSALIGFAEDFAALGGGRYLLSDAILGGIWVAEADGRVRPGIVPKSTAPADQIPQLKLCPTMPQITVGGIPFLFSGATQPGVSPLAVRDGTVYFYSPCAGGLFSVPLTTFFDRRQPYERARDIRLIARKPSDKPVEELLAFAFNPNSLKDPYLYAANALELQLIRIDPRSGARQVLGKNQTLFNFPSSLGLVPDALGSAALLVVSNQQHRTPLTNAAITQDITQPPFVVTRVDVF